MKTIEIYLRKNAKTTEILVEHIAQYIDVINKTTVINFNYVTKKSEAMAREQGIENFPMIVNENTRIEGLKEILRYITPANYNPEYKSESEMMLDLQSKWLQEEDDDQSMSDIVDDTEIRKKMKLLQEKRPKMSGVENKIEGGREIQYNNKTEAAANAENDEDFLNKIGDSDNINHNDNTNMDGQEMLDDYFSNII